MKPNFLLSVLLLFFGYSAIHSQSHLPLSFETRTTDTYTIERGNFNPDSTINWDQNAWPEFPLFVMDQEAATYDPCNIPDGVERPITTNPQNGSNYIARGGSRSFSYAAVLRMTHDFMVTPENNMLLLDYAFAFNKSNRNSETARPTFAFVLTNSAGDTIPCTYLHLIDNDQLVTNFGFHECSSYYQKDWSTIGFPLLDNIGETITIDIFMSGGMASPAPLFLFDLDCGNMQIGILNYCENNGSAKLQAPRGFESYQWSNGDTTQFIDLANAVAGETYSVDLINQLGCMHTLSFTIPNQSSLPLPTLGEDQAFSKCGDTTYVFHPQGQNLGKVMLAETGVFQDSFVISNKFQQIYTFIAFSESGCPTDTLIYEHHNSPSPQEDYQNIVCIGDANGHVIYPENYGSQQFSYTWSNGVMSNVNDNLSPDQYYVTITDQWGCTTMDDFIIDEESRRFELEIYSIKDQFCENDIAGGNVFFQMSGGNENSSYFFSVDSVNYIEVELTTIPYGNGFYPPGDHKIYAMDDRGCRDSIEFTMESLPLPRLLDYEVWLDEPCDNPNALNVAINEVEVFTPDYDAFLIGDTRGTSFQNDTVLGFSMENENFSIYLRDDNFCRDTFEIEIPTTYPEIDSIISSPETCSQSNGTLQVFSVSPDIEYSLDGINFQEEAIFEGLSADFYDVYISNGTCSTKSVTRIINEEGLDPEVELKDPDCENGNNGSIRIIAPAGASYTYVWEDGSVDSSLENIGPGDYIVTISSGNCTTEFTYSLSNGSTIEVDLNPINPITCMEGSNGSFSVQARNGASPYQYSIDNGLTLFTSGLFENLAPNTYNILIIDANDCEKDTTFTIESFDAPIITEYTIVNDSCGNGVGELFVDEVDNGTAPYIYSLDGMNYDLNNRFENLLAGPYTVYVQDDNGCSSALEVTIDPLDAVFIEDLLVQNIGCDNPTGRIEVLTNTNVNNFYTINGGAPQSSNQFTDLMAGDFTIAVINDFGCSYDSTATIEEVESPEILEVEQINYACEGEADSLIVTAILGQTPYTYQIDNGEFQTSNLFEDLSPGDHELTLRDANGCIIRQTITIENIAPLTVINAVTENPACGNPNGSIAFELVGGIGSPSIDFNGEIFNNAIRIENLPQDQYAFQIFDESNCNEMIQYTLDASCPIYAPNIFSPNGDNINDVFQIHGDPNSGALIKTYQIFDRWGSLVFESKNFSITDASNWWTGRKNGKSFSTGVFVYFIEVEFPDGRVEVFKGDVTLVR